jgi:HD-GYP domain-containing protein (c-di-GMP phosphodiesterase class II)
VPDAVLLKAGPLNPEERAAIEAHVTIGHRMLDALPFLDQSLPSVRGHHERWDGAGYPDKLGGTDIHPHARLMGVADSFDAMTSARPYRNALPVEEAMRRLRADSGRQFDPAAIELFESVALDVEQLLKTHSR